MNLPPEPRTLPMFARKSLRLPIVLAVVMIALLIAMIVGWVVLTVPASDEESAAVYWTALSLGTTFLTLILVGVVVYLALSIKAINLTRRQSNFIDSVTHELKSPIASLKLYLQTLDRHRVPIAEREDFYRFMLEDVERLDHLINHVLEAGRLEKEAVDDEIEEVVLDGMLAECAKSTCLRYRLPIETIQLDLQPCIVEARLVDLDIIFRNLIDNAVKYAGVEPRVRVSLAPGENDTVIVQIADNGQGIPRKFRRKVFGRFVRLGLELERQKPGTGLGLYLVRTLVRRLRGRVTVREPAGGSGTLFEVRLPGHASSLHLEDADAPAAERALPA